MGNKVTVQLNQPGRNQNFIARASFNLEPTKTSKSISINTEVTHQELDSLFSTKQYERPYQPEYYNPLDDIIGELWTEATQDLALSAVIDKVQKFIPYLVVDQSRTEFSYQNYNIIMNLVFYHDFDFSKTLYNYERQFDRII